MFNVLTTRGIIPINQITFGDKVYEYMTGNLLEVKSVVSEECCKLINVLYTDGRVEQYYCNENIYTGKRIIKACDLDTNDKLPCITLFRVDFHPGLIREPLYPDPYTAAALLIYGDYDDEYLNYPLDRVEANCTFSHKYNVTYFPYVAPNKVYFQWKGKDTDNRITWKEFFPKYDFYAKTKCGSDPPFPYEYLFASIKDRIQFIRGAFDMGYDKSKNPDKVSINHWNLERLKWIQWMLWSLGIQCSIRDYSNYYDHDGFYKNKNRFYQLDIEGWKSTYPGFFYWIEYLEQMITFDERHLLYYAPEPFKIKGIKSIKEELTTSYQLVLEKPNALYITSLFLPRISL